MSLESAKDRSYDVPPADERKGKAKAERDRCLGKPIITHRSMLTRYPVGTRAAPRQKNVAGMNYWRRPAAIRPMSAESRGVPRAAAGIARTRQRREARRLGGPPWTRQTAFQSHATGACVTVAHVLVRNESAAQESTRGFRSAPADPSGARGAPFRGLVFYACAAKAA
jgi:hypothetical protein